MFTFSHGFEAATLKIPNKDSTAYSGVSNQSLNASTNGAASTASNASAPSNERRGTITSATYAGASDPYNLVTVNSGGVVVDSRDLPGGTQTSAVWPGELFSRLALQFDLCSPTITSFNSLCTVFLMQGSTTGQGQSQAQQPPRKQIIGFAKFTTRTDALHARDVLQSKRVDAEKSAVLKAEMAKKNLHTKRGVGGPSGNTAPNGVGTQSEINGARNLAPPREQGPLHAFRCCHCHSPVASVAGPVTGIYNQLSTSGVFGSSNGPGLPLVNGSVSHIPNPNSIACDLHTSFALSVREREQAALAAMGVSTTLGGRQGPEFTERDYLEDRMLEHHMRQQQHDIFSRGADPYHQSLSASGASSTSSFSPERAPAIRNPVHSGEIDLDFRGTEDAISSRVIDVATGLIGAETSATPMANRAAWPTESHYTEVFGQREQWRDDLEQQDSQQDRNRDLRSPTDAHHPASDASSPLSSSALQIRHPTDVHLEREREHVEESTFIDSGVGDVTLTAPSRPGSRAAPHRDSVPSSGEQPLPTPPRQSIPRGVSPCADPNQSSLEHEQQQDGATLPPPAAVSLPVETLEGDVPTGANTEVGKWPRSASATSASSRSEHSSPVHESNFSGDFCFPEALQKQNLNPSVTSSTGYGTPPEANCAPSDLPPEEDEGDQISPLDQLGFQSLHNHLPLNHLPRHQLSGQSVAFQQHRMHEIDRGLHFNESIFDGRGTGNRNPSDLGSLEARFNEFSISNGPSALRDTSPPISSPPLQSMNPVISGRGSNHDARPNIDQNPPVCRY